MTYQRFEDLPVWQDAISLAEGVFSLTEVAERTFRRRASLKNQLERAVVSISNNIAEGFERGTTQELINFLYIARGSSGEVRSMLLFIERSPLFSDFKSQISDLKSLSEGCSRQLRAWSQSLQDSKIKGPKHMTAASREEYRRDKEAERFEAEKRQFLEELRQSFLKERSQ